MSKYRIGTIVRLRSGGPAMTVERSDPNNENGVYCAYFIDGVPQAMPFDEAELEPSFPTERELLGEPAPQPRKFVQMTVSSVLFALDSTGVIWARPRDKWTAIPSTPWEDKE